MQYLHLRNKGRYQEGPTGPVVYRTNITVPVTANQREYNLEENSPLERNILVGLWVTEQGVKTGDNTTQVVTAIFNSCALTLRVQESDVVKKIYAHQIKAANDQGNPFYVYLPGRINLSESKLEIYNNAGILANDVFEFQAEYVKYHHENV